MKASSIKFKRGNRADLPKSAPSGTPLWCIDTQELYLGTDNGVKKVGGVSQEIDTTNEINPIGNDSEDTSLLKRNTQIKMQGGKITAENFVGNLSGNATSATKATKDGSNNNIEDTYLKKAGGTITGNLTVNGTTNGTFSGNLTGNVTGNATSATKATNDGSNNNIENTYLKKTGGTITGNLTVNGTTNGTFKGNLTGNVTGNSSSASIIQTARTINGTAFDGSSDINTQYSYNFKFGEVTWQSNYSIFAKSKKSNVTQNSGAILLVSGCGSNNYGNVGTWLVEITNIGNKPTMIVRSLIYPNKTSIVTFGYYEDAENGEYCFGVKCPGYRGDIAVTVIRSKNIELGVLSDSNTIPTGWTPVEDICGFMPDNKMAAYVIETYTTNNNRSGYRLWSDNYLEQWGTTGLLADKSLTTVNLLKRYQGDYFITKATLVPSSTDDNAFNDATCIRYYSMYMDSFQIYSRGSSVANRYVSWYTGGYLKTSSEGIGDLGDLDDLFG